MKSRFRPFLGGRYGILRQIRGRLRVSAVPSQTDPRTVNLGLEVRVKHHARPKKDPQRQTKTMLFHEADVGVLREASSRQVSDYSRIIHRHQRARSISRTNRNPSEVQTERRRPQASKKAPRKTLAVQFRQFWKIRFQDKSESGSPEWSLTCSWMITLAFD